MGAGALGAVILAKTQHNALLVGVDNIYAREQPQAHYGKNDHKYGPSVGKTHTGDFGKRVFTATAATAIAATVVKGRALSAGGFILLLHVVSLKVLRLTGRRIRTLLLPFFL